MPSIAPRDRLIIALDLPAVADARALVARLGPAVTFYKIGLELVMCGGLDLVRELASAGKQVFLDMKLLDIENTVERATRNAAAAATPDANNRSSWRRRAACADWRAAVSIRWTRTTIRAATINAATTTATVTMSDAT